MKTTLLSRCKPNLVLQMAVSQYKRKLIIPQYSFADARRLSEDLGISMTLASVLARRGYTSANKAREFLEEGYLHDPDRMRDIDAASKAISDAIDRGKMITVHGDYDADGICSTAIALGSLRRLGARANWFIPSRFDDGYGISIENIEKLASRGTELLIAVDCGVSSVGEVKKAKDLGMQVVICDHHRWNKDLPDCPVVHPRIGEYPFHDLCAAAVTYKLMQHLYSKKGSDSEDLEDELDLVALATVADMVPLVGENRDLTKRGLRKIGYTSRPGLRALMEAARIDRDEVGATDIAFRIAPRLNAAGRLYRADAGVELLLTDDDTRAKEIAKELGTANRKRQDVEQKILREAEVRRSQIMKSEKDPLVLVLAGEGWHQGVIGIVASRMARRYNRPCVMIALPDDGHNADEKHSSLGSGSGRSIRPFDLHAALSACAEHLERFGGHKMAAGLEIAPDKVDGFSDALAKYASERLTTDDLTPTQQIDAVIPGDSLDMDLAEELKLLEPHGEGNRAINLMVPSADVGDVRPMGEGKHARFKVKSAGTHFEGVAFGCDGKLPLDQDTKHDVSFSLEINRWNGSVEPRMVLKGLTPIKGSGGVSGCLRCECRADVEEWWSLVKNGYESTPDIDHDSAKKSSCREIVDGRGKGVYGNIGELVSTGEPVAVLTADVSRRRSIISEQFDAKRFGATDTVLLTKRCSSDVFEAVESRDSAEGLLTFFDYEIADLHGELLSRFDHIVMLDPPLLENGIERVRRTVNNKKVGASFLHLLWGSDEVEFTKKVVEQELGLRAPLSTMYREMKNAEDGRSIQSLSATELRDVLEGRGEHPRPPRLVGRCLKILSEIDVVKVESFGHRTRIVLSDLKEKKPELAQSNTYKIFRTLYKESSRFLKVALISKWE